MTYPQYFAPQPCHVSVKPSKLVLKNPAIDPTIGKVIFGIGRKRAHGGWRKRVNVENEAVKTVLYLDLITIWREHMPLYFPLFIKIEIAPGVEIAEQQLLSNH